MATLAELQRQIDRLEQEAENVRKTELADVIARIRVTVAQYDLTPADIFGRKVGSSLGRRSGKAAAKAPRLPKYRDPKSGKTWTGMGKPPNWIAGVRNRDKFLIDASVADEAVEISAPPAKKSRKATAAGSKVAKKTAKRSARKRVEKAPEAATEASGESA